jgi:hypothetical protein
VVVAPSSGIVDSHLNQLYQSANKQEAMSGEKKVDKVHQSTPARLPSLHSLASFSAGVAREEL